MTKCTVEGNARKIALTTLALSVIGYHTYVIGWGVLFRKCRTDGYSSFGSGVNFFAFWYCIAAGPVVFACCLLRVVLLLQPCAHYVLMVITFVFFSTYISVGGYILYYFGMTVNAFDAKQPSYFNAVFAGMIITQLFSTVTGAVLGFIDTKDRNETYIQIT